MKQIPSELVEHVVSLLESRASGNRIKKSLRAIAPSLKGPQVKETLRLAKERLKADRITGPGSSPQTFQREIGRGQRQASSSDRRPSPSSPPTHPSRRIVVGRTDLDDAWLGLSLLACELQRNWNLGYDGELGFWRARRGHGGPPKERASFRQWVAEGGEGRYLLFPEAVRDYLGARGLDAERVLVDLKDRGITEADPGHSTKLCWADGKTKRFVVLPDKFVKHRSSWTLGSVVGINKGREARDRGFYRV